MVGLGVIEFIIQSRLQDKKEPCLDCAEKSKKLLDDFTKELGPVAEDAWKRFITKEITSKELVRILKENYKDKINEYIINNILNIENTEGCPDVDFSGIKVPKCLVDTGVGHAINLCGELNNIDCNELLSKYEDGNLSGERLLEILNENTTDEDIKYNLNVIKKTILGEVID